MQLSAYVMSQSLLPFCFGIPLFLLLLLLLCVTEEPRGLLPHIKASESERRHTHIFTCRNLFISTGLALLLVFVSVCWEIIHTHAHTHTCTYTQTHTRTHERRLWFPSDKGEYQICYPAAKLLKEKHTMMQEKRKEAASSLSTWICILY